jgi:hypothetical protein
MREAVHELNFFEHIGTVDFLLIHFEHHDLICDLVGHLKQKI